MVESIVSLSNMKHKNSFNMHDILQFTYDYVASVQVKVLDSSTKINARAVRVPHILRVCKGEPQRPETKR